MADQFSALAAIAQKPGQPREDALVDFYNKWQHDFLVVNEWFALQSASDISENVENVEKLLDHPAFDLKNPNTVFRNKLTFFAAAKVSSSFPLPDLPEIAFAGSWWMSYMIEIW